MLDIPEVLDDPRFCHLRVTSDDIPMLILEISVLSNPRVAATPTDFEPLTHGIYLTCGERSGFCR